MHCTRISQYIYIYVNAPMIGKAVEIRLTIFPARYGKTLHRFTLSQLADFLGARSRPSASTVPPPPQPRGRGGEGDLYCRQGGLPRRGPGAAERGDGPKWGLMLSTDTAFGTPPMSTTKYLEPGALTRYGRCPDLVWAAVERRQARRQGR
jgi:hypothetical protein